MSKPFARSIFDVKSAVFQHANQLNARAMRDAEHTDPEVLSRRQLDRAMALVRHSYENVPFYRERYAAAGFKLRDLGQTANFVELPILEKSDIRAAGDSMRSVSARSRDVLRSTTGGSTGQPLVVLQDRRTPAASLWWRAYRWWGIHPGDDTAVVYRLGRSRRQELLHRVEWWPTRHFLLDARGMDDSSMRGFIDTWMRVRPRLLTGYVDGLHEFARFVRRSGVDLPPPDAIAVTASVLTAPKRAYIESVLSAPLYDNYRSAEVPWMAAQCLARQGLHVFADVRRIEIIDPSGAPAADGVVGNVLVTDLLNTLFPIIRYRIGDRAAARSTPCSCGMTLPRIDAIEGRVADVLRTPSGLMVTGGLSVLFNANPTAVTQFQLHQLADYTVVLRYVPGSSEEDARTAASKIRNQIRTMLRDSVDVRLDRVDRIEHIAGKVRLVVSDLPAE